MDEIPWSWSGNPIRPAGLLGRSAPTVAGVCGGGPPALADRDLLKTIKVAQHITPLGPKAHYPTCGSSTWIRRD